jgi:hypothetical protein
METMLVSGQPSPTPLLPEHELIKTRVILHNFVSATTLLLENIISDPTHRRVYSDLKLIEPLLTLLSALAKDGKNEEVAAMYQSCGQMFEKTSKIVQDACAAGRGEPRKIMGKQDGKETLEEFIRRIESVSAGHDDDEMELIPQGFLAGEGREDRNAAIGFPNLSVSDSRMSTQIR